jgi:hypothetical protein
MRNIAQEADTLELSIQGVPISWITLPSPVIYLLGGEEKTVDIFITVPPTPEVRAGYYPLKITAVSQKNPDLKGEVEVKLGIAAFESQGRIGVMMNAVQFSAAPGSSLTIPLTMLNRGLEADTFRLGVEGIPVSWVSTSTPASPLEPGESKEVTLLIRPPLSPSSEAGRYKFGIVVTSQGTPDQHVKVDCVLTLPAYMKVSANLEPREVEAGQPVRVVVQNDGNIQQVLHLTCVSQNDQLIFEFLPPEGVKQPVTPASTGIPSQPDGVATSGTQPGSAQNLQPQAPLPDAGEQTSDPTILQIPPGASGAFRFSAQPRQRKLIGGAVSFPYQVLVGPKQKEALTLPGQVLSRGMIPIWVLLVALVLCLLLVFAISFSLLRDAGETNSATQTSAAATVSSCATQTVQVGTVVAAGNPNDHANQTPRQRGGAG